MLFLYQGRTDVPAWTALRDGRWHVVAAAGTRPGGPVLFTAEDLGERWIQRMQAKGEDMDEVEVVRVGEGDGTVQAAVTLWRRLFESVGYTPRYYSVCLIDPTDALHPAYDMDAQAIPFDPDTVPEGIVLP